jgi:Holliday junction resolvase RusA-like endonuclease
MPEVKETAVEITSPPSANKLWRMGKNRKTGASIMHKSKEYSDWLATAQVELLIQRPESIMGEVEVFISIWRHHALADLDNRIKPILDVLQGSVFENDKQVMRVTATWAPVKLSPACYVVVRPFVRNPE